MRFRKAYKRLFLVNVTDDPHVLCFNRSAPIHSFNFSSQQSSHVLFVWLALDIAMGLYLLLSILNSSRFIFLNAKLGNQALCSLIYAANSVCFLGTINPRLFCVLVVLWLYLWLIYLFTCLLVHHNYQLLVFPHIGKTAVCIPQKWFDKKTAKVLKPSPNFVN